MKECKKCSKQYDDSFVFCPDCGERLSPSAPKISKRNALLIVCIAATLLIAGGSVHELSQVKSQKDAIEQSKYDRALQEYLSTPTTGGLTILSDWTTRTSRNYLYIEGTVKNTSSKDVRYYEIGSNFWTAAEMSSTPTGQTARTWTPVIPSDLRASAQKISVALPAPLKRVVRLQFHSQNAPFLIYPST